MNKTYYERLDETVYRSQLPNGLRLCVVPKKGFSRKCAYFVTNYGAIHTAYALGDTKYRSPDGVAHYLEHQMFSLPDRDVSEEFAAMGASPNAFTSYDMTAYYFTCTEQFYDCLKLLLEFVCTPYFTPESVEKERGIIEQEILMYQDSPDSRVFELLLESLYAHHPVRFPIAGSVRSIQTITPEILYACHRAFYCPANMMLCVEGDVDPERVEALARAVLPREQLPVGEKDLGVPEQPTPHRRESVEEMDVSMPTFQLGFKCRGDLKGEAFARWEAVGELAGEALFGESSRLYLELYEQGLIDSSFGGGLETLDGAAVFTCGGDSNDPRAVREAVLARAAQLAQTGISPEELRRSKKSLLGRRIKDLDSFESACFRLCAYAAEDYDYFSFPDAIESVEMEEIQQFLQETVREERAALAIVTPRSQKEE